MRDSDIACESPTTVHTVGHSTRSADRFIALLKTHAVERLVDVRRWPASARYPHFNRKALADELNRNGIDYLWRGDLGGFRKPSPESPHTAWRAGAFRAYADFMLTEAFAQAMREMEGIAGRTRIAFMCAEAVPWRCHRQLIADAFVVRGWSVRHIMDDGCHEHSLPGFAKVVEENKIYYSGDEI